MNINFYCNISFIVTYIAHVLLPVQILLEDNGYNVLQNPQNENICMSLLFINMSD